MTLVVSNVQLESTGNVVLRKADSGSVIQLRSNNSNLFINSSSIYCGSFVVNSTVVATGNGAPLSYIMNDEFFVSAGDQPPNTAPFDTVLTASQYSTLPSRFIQTPSPNLNEWDSAPSRAITTTTASLYWIRKIAYGNNRYVGILGSKTGFTTSTDFVTWTDGTFANSGIMEDIAFGSGIFVAVGTYGTASGAETAAVQTSTDGITWTNRTIPENTSGYNRAYGVAYGAGRFVAALVQDGAQGTMARPLRISTNGITWTNNNITELAGTTGADNIEFSDGVFTVILNEGGLTDFTFDERGGDRISNSTDGITWSSMSTLPSVGSPRPHIASAYGNGVYITIGDFNDVFRSTNFTTWTALTPAVMTGTATDFTSILYDPAQDIFIITSRLSTGASGIDNMSNRLFYSTDKGLTWLRSNNNIRLGGIADMIKDQNQLIVAGLPFFVNTSFTTSLVERKIGDFLTYPFNINTQIKTVAAPAELANVDNTYTKTYVRY